MVNNETEAWLALDILRIPSRVQRMILEQPKTSAVAFLENLLTRRLPSPTKQWPPMDSELLSKACKQATEVLKVLNKRDMWVVTPETHPWLFATLYPPVCLYGIGNRQILSSATHKKNCGGWYQATDTRSTTQNTGLGKTLVW